MKPTFNAGQALSFAIEVFKARPADFILISVWTVLYGAVFSLIQIQLMGPEMIALADPDVMAVSGNGEIVQPEQEVMAMFGVLGDYFGALIPFVVAGLVISVFVESAWLRLFVRGENLGVIPFRFGRDERVYAVSGFLLLLVLIVALIVGFLGMLLLAIVFGIGGMAGIAIGTTLGTVFFVGLMAATLTIIMPVLALSVLTGKVALRDGIRGARQVFWPLLGSALVAVILAFIATAFYSGLVGYLPYDQFGRGTNGQMAGWAALLGYYLVVQIISLVPAALLRGIASYAALRIDDSNRPLSQTFE